MTHGGTALTLAGIQKATIQLPQASGVCGAFKTVQSYTTTLRAGGSPGPAPSDSAPHCDTTVYGRTHQQSPPCSLTMKRLLLCDVFSGVGRLLLLPSDSNLARMLRAISRLGLQSSSTAKAASPRSGRGSQLSNLSRRLRAWSVRCRQGRCGHRQAHTYRRPPRPTEVRLLAGDSLSSVSFARIHR